jgi:hypothetical protein
MSPEPQRADHHQEPDGSDPAYPRIDGGPNQKIVTDKCRDCGNHTKTYPRQKEQEPWRTERGFTRQIALIAMERQRAQAELAKAHNVLDSERVVMRMHLRQLSQDNHSCQMRQNGR